MGVRQRKEEEVVEPSVVPKVSNFTQLDFLPLIFSQQQHKIGQNQYILNPNPNPNQKVSQTSCSIYLNAKWCLFLCISVFLF